MGLDDVDVIIDPEHRKQGIVDQVMEKNRKFAKENEEKEEEFDMMQGLNDIAEEKPQEQTEDSDVAPVSPYADSLTVEEQIKKDEKDKQE
jgi:predicted GNAT family acetyltransferase